jgi:acyl carrier protein
VDADKKTIIKQIIAENTGVKDDKVTLQANFVADLGADSICKMDIIMGIEDNFDILIPDRDACKINNMQEAIDYLENKI